jgi:hypothetical protein
MNQLEAEGLIKDYAIGGSVALMHYCEPFYTQDLDIYCFLTGNTLLIDLGPVYRRLQELGYKPDGESIIIEGVKVQVVPPHGALSEEAIRTAVSTSVEGVSTRVFQYEFALAMKTNAGRPKDWAHLATAVASQDPDMIKLKSIFEKFGLVDAWRKHGLPI